MVSAFGIWHLRSVDGDRRHRGERCFDIMSQQFGNANAAAVFLLLDAQLHQALHLAGDRQQPYFRHEFALGRLEDREPFTSSCPDYSFDLINPIEWSFYSVMM